MSGTVYDRMLTDEDAPHVVDHQDGIWGLFDARRRWLRENGEGRYAWRRRVIDVAYNRRGWRIIYRFTDADTAFWFKMAAP